jgi:signal peptidase I
MMSESVPPQLPAVKVGFIAIVVLTVLSLAQAVASPVFGIAQALVLIAIAIGLRRGNAWSAYGGMLFLIARVVGMALTQLVSPTGIPGVNLIAITMLALVNGVAAGLLFWAGRALSHRRSGAAVPWLAFGAVVLVFSFVFEPFSVPSGSMENTLLIGDCILVQRIAARRPVRGDLIVLRYPIDPMQTFIKRVAAAGGDRLQFKDKRLFINGALQNEPYAIHKTDVPDAFRDNFPQPIAMGPPLVPAYWSELLSKGSGGELVVPPGKYFVLGDNRDNSLDSRYWGWVEQRHIIGRPALIYFSAQPPSGGPPRALDQLPLVRPRSIRWNRLFKLL